MLQRRKNRRCALGFAQWRVSLSALLLSSVIGCQTALLRPGTEGTSQATGSTASAKNKPETKSAPAADPFKSIVDDNWVLAVSPPDSSEPPRYRWRNRVIEDLLSSPREKQPDWQAAMATDRTMVRINAAIALARLGEGTPAEVLASAVRGADLKLPVRRAAAEAMGEVHSKTATDEIHALLEQYGKFTGEARSRYVPELHADLLHALARQSGSLSAANSQLAEALKSPAGPVKREALENLAALSGNNTAPLPTLALDLTTDGDPQVRIAALKLIVARRHDQAEEKIIYALSDYELMVRTAAIELLGEVGGAEAIARLKKLAVDSSELVRVAAISALLKTGDREAVEAAAGDASWRVRRKVAKSCSQFVDRRSLNIARQLLGDPSLEVQREVIRMTSAWPTEQAGTFLLAAMESSNYQTRKDAATQLADRWPNAAGFPIDAPAPRRAELLASLQSAWTAEFGNLDRSAIAANVRQPKIWVSADQLREVSHLVEQLSDTTADSADQAATVESLVQLGSELPSILDALAADENRPLPEKMYREILPRCAAEFEHLQKFAEGNSVRRRQSMLELAKLANKQMLSNVALARLQTLLVTEADPVVWLPVFKVIERDPRESAAMIATTGLSHPSPEIRRRACGYFAAYPDMDRAALLVNLLKDSNTSVLHAALEAMAALPTAAEVPTVEQLLSHNDHGVRLDAALVLASWKCESGAAALDRLAADGDPQLRRKTAQAIGKLGDPNHVGILVKLLDDQQDVRRAALIGLRSLTGSENPPGLPAGVQPAAFSSPADSGNSDRSLAEQAEQWKTWYRNNARR